MAKEEKKTVKPAPETKAVVNEKADKKAAKEAVKAEKAAAKAAKENKPAKPEIHEARAIARNIRTTPRKVRLVADAVRGKSVSDALAMLGRVNKVGCLPLEKIIKSASANAVNNFGMDKDTLYVAELQVSDGMRIKRFTPRAKGSASPLIKRNCYILCVIKDRK